MTFPATGAAALLATLFACCTAGAQPPPPAPPFDVAYRAWEIVTDMARRNRAPAIAGACAATFRPFVIPGLRRQTLAEQDVAASACVAAATAACADAGLQRSADSARQCAEFR